MFAELTVLCQKQPYGLRLLPFTRKNCFAYQAIVIVLLSLIAFAINHFIYQYPGNLYIPSGTILVLIQLPLMYAGFYMLYGHAGKMTRMVKEGGYFFGIIALVGLITNAVQYTPFPTIDQHLLAFESFFNIDTQSIITWTHANPVFKSWLETVYISLPYQLYYIPFFVIAAGRTDLMREHYFLLITTALIGFTFYYFFPTTAPASVLNSPYFSEAQRATYLKFYQLHHYIQPSTQDGGLIALPSFHVIWAWLGLYLLRAWPVAFMLLLPINIVLTASCVLLGWHYFIDLAGAVVVILFAHGLYSWTLSKSTCKKPHALLLK